MPRTFSLAVVIAVSLGAAATPAAAVPTPITPTNFDGLGLLDYTMADPWSHPVSPDAEQSPASNIVGTVTGDTLGTLEGKVWLDTTYIYAVRVFPQVGNISVFGSPGIAGFTGVAGYSFTDVATENAVDPTTPFEGFDIIYNGDTDQSLSWLVKENNGSLQLWTDQTSITFFFGSTLPPYLGEPYSLINLEPGSGISYVPTPVPEPASLLLLGSGLVGVGLLTRRLKFRRTGSL